ncbi:MAG: hypothetical protein AUJ55_05230 [Proteobacteria bacterium CG1_02_64_396]|nr:MAG: hypothetical protein AUJ55_05230 [Proteobacteria bacterium CG1_02_64_396]
MRRIVLLLAPILLAPLAQAADTPAAPPPTPVIVAVAEPIAWQPEANRDAVVTAPNPLHLGFRVVGQIAEVTVQIGDRVGQGTTLATLRRAPLERAMRTAAAKVVDAEADRDLAEAELKQTTQLAAGKHASELELKRAQSRLDRAKALVEQLQAALEQAQDDLAASRLTAPVAGQVVAINEGPGAWMQTGQAVVTLIPDGGWSVEFQIPFSELPPAGTEVSVPAYEVTGLPSVLREGDRRLRLATLRLYLPPNTLESHLLVGGQAATVTWKKEGVSIDAARLSRDAIVYSPQGQIAWVLNPDNTVRPLPLKPVGALEGDLILTDLPPGSRVVVQGKERLRPGAAVAIQEEGAK